MTADSASRVEVEKLAKRPAYWTHDADAVDAVGHLYYFAPSNAAPGPYTRQKCVEAIIDIASDGTLAGVELIDDMPPPPPYLIPSPVDLDGLEKLCEAATPGPRGSFVMMGK